MLARNTLKVLSSRLEVRLTSQQECVSRKYSSKPKEVFRKEKADRQ